MAEERKNKLLGSPVFAFVTKGWVKWSQKIVTLQAGEEDFLLYLVWALDTIKEQEDGTNACFYDTVYNALRNCFRASQFNTNKNDLDYLTDLVCAAALACFGLTLTDSQENQKIYSELVSGFGEHWKDINDLKSSMDTNSPDLKDWVLEYVESDDFYFPPYAPINGSLYKLKDIVIDGSKLHFNDVLYSSVYKPYYMYNSYAGTNEPLKFYMGHQVICPCCGKELLRDSERMVCDNCYYEYHANEDC